MRRFYLVSYDVVDDRRRNRVAKRLLDYGERVQYSVFCCQLNPRELHRLQEDLKGEMNCDEDQTLFVDAGAVEGEHPIPDLSYLGRVWKPEARTQVV